jgi:hypothetical protein
MTMRLDQGPQTAARRSVLDVLAGLAAIAALLVLLAGVPLALIAAFGLPVPHTLPSLTLLTHRLDLATVIRVCSVVVWLAWLQLVWCVAAEVTAAVRNTGMPTKVPLAGTTQALAHRLVTSALLLSTAATLSPALVPAPPATVAAAGWVPGQPMAATGTGEAPPVATAVRAAGALLAAPVGGALAPPAAAGSGRSSHNGAAAVTPSASDVAELLATGSAAPAVADDARRTEKIYVVRPPEGRFHESLWEIAERHLGDGRRYRDIFELNDGRVQPDGTTLTIASLIRPGWILVMPPDAHGPGIRVVQAPLGGHAEPRLPVSGHRMPARRPATAHPAHSTEPGQPSPARPGLAANPTHTARAAHRPQPGRTAQPGPNAQPGGTAQPNRTAQPGRAGQAPHTRPARTVHHAPPGRQAQPAHPVPGHPAAHRGAAHPAAATAGPSLASELRFPLELAGAGLLAAGVLVALARRRRRQQGHRAFGRRLAVPPPDAAWTEAALRLGEDPGAAAVLDGGLRYLAQALAEEGRTPPTVFAAHLGDHNLDLWVAPASAGAPEPWFAVGDGQVWRLPLEDAPGLDPGGARFGPAPYPGLVTIGADGTGRVLVDVTAAAGLISVTGPESMVRDTLTAMATELATSRWSEGIRLTLVGFGADLGVIAPDRVQVVPTLADALPALESWASQAADVPDIHNRSATADRPEPARAEALEPQYLITAEPPPGAERDRLLALARTGHLAGGAYLAAGEVPGAAWTWDITPAGRLRAGQLGLEVAAQFIPHEQQLAMTGLFEAADEMAGAALSAPVLDPALGEAPARLAPAPVEVTLLGPVLVRMPGDPAPENPGLATEIVVYLATHPGGVHPNLLTAMIWPGGIGQDERDAALRQVREWLGSDDIGRPHLASDAAGRLRLGSGVRVDWQVFCTLVALAGQAAQPGDAPPGGGPSGGREPGGGPAGPPRDRARGGAHAVGASRHDRERLEETLLAEALSLVSGPFLGEREPGRYAWLAVDGLEYEVAARVADAAHRLCQLRLAGGDPDGAMDALHAGLRLAPEDQLLWRDLITAAHATGREDLLRSVVGEICGWARVGDRMAGLAPATETLIDELLPTWRWSLP